MSAAENQQIDFDGYLVTHYTKLPNMAFEELEPYAYKLLAVYLDTIRQAEKGVCFKSNETIAKQLGCSVNRMKKARQELVKLGYIVVALGTETTSRVTLQLSKMWKKNHEIESKKQEERRQEKQSQGGYQDLTPPYQTVTGGVSQFDTKEKESNKTQLKKEKETTSAPTAPAQSNLGKTVQEKLSKPERDAWYEAVKTVWGFVAGRNEDYQKFARGEHTDTKKKSAFIEYALLSPFKSPSQLIAWGKFEKAKNPDITMISSPSKVQDSVSRWMDGTKRAETRIIYAEPATPPSATDGMVTFGERPVKKEQAS
jgi:hypothetical protein